jgi:beta-phosphoglucomutase-like phosphatase (HAD superfamily)
VIEDSYAGAKAGVAAGMDVFGFTGVAHDKEHANRRLTEAGVVDIFDDFIHMRDALRV